MTDEILEIDHQNSITPSPDLYNKRISLQTDFDLLSTDETAKLLLQNKHRLYEQGEKTGHLLAHQIHQAASSRLIAEIRTASGEILTDQQEINSEFKTFIQISRPQSPKVTLH